MGTRILAKEDLEETLALIRKGEVVAFPTDTVYGIGVRFDDLGAVEKMRRAKERDAGKPFPLMVSGPAEIGKVAELRDDCRELIANLMPGALTIIVRKKPVIPAAATLGRDTVAIRIPDDQYCRELLRKAGPMWVTSANLSGQKPADDEREVLEQLGGRIAAVVRGKGGSAVPSTIVDLTERPARILRQGTVTKEMIGRYLKEEL